LSECQRAALSFLMFSMCETMYNCS